MPQEWTWREAHEENTRSWQSSMEVWEPPPFKVREASFNKQDTLKAGGKLGKNRAKGIRSENGSKKHRINLAVSNATRPQGLVVLSADEMPGTILNALCLFLHLTLTTIPWGRQQRSWQIKLPCPRSHGLSRLMFSEHSAHARPCSTPRVTWSSQQPC